MPHPVHPNDTTRATAYALWMQAPNPMVTFFKTLDVTSLVKLSRKRGLKFNMLLDYCIGRAAVSIPEFFLLPVGDALMQYDSIAVNTIVQNRTGQVSSCDLPRQQRPAKTTTCQRRAWSSVHPPLWTRSWTEPLG